VATEVLMPRQGNTVESCVILDWKKREGDSIQEGDIICEVETDKAAFEVEAPASGTVIKTFFEEGDDVPVLTVIAAIGEAGEDVSGLAPAEASPAAKAEKPGPRTGPVPAGGEAAASAESSPEGPPISPRAKLLAQSKGIDFRTVAGSGPGGRIIERDIQYVLGSREPFTPAAIEEQLKQGVAGPAAGSGLGGRVTAADVAASTAGGPAAGAAAGSAAAEYPGPVEEKPVKGVRKLIAERMRGALQSTAQLTMNGSADARTILAYRKKLKAMPEESGLTGITLNDFILFAVSRNLRVFNELNAHFLGDTVKQFAYVHLGFAVDTPRGLMVPVIRNAHALTLKQISAEAKRLSSGCLEGGINPDELSGGTFTVTNLGAFGIESFTPIANAPEVGILGVNAIQPKPVAGENGETVFVPHIGFSLTIDHQLIDGALGAKFLRGMAEKIENFDITLAG
jgi:pyruvate dehydrogenase E2 component (dihydrolipoamide acetyltransferase)